MAELVQLDVAAALVGKSEVTLRRLIKTGKVPVHKEKTLTGFIYLVDPEKIRAWYGSKGTMTFDSLEEDTPEREEVAEEEVVARPRPAGRRLAVAGEAGDEVAYWQKRAEAYEDRYHTEMQKHAHAREELGVWRGRAEHAQAMLMKLLPPVPEILANPATEAINETHKSAPSKRDASPAVMALLVATVVVSFFLLAGAIVYVTVIRG